MDDLIARMTQARARADFVDTIRAMDRVLMWGHYLVPLYHLNDDRYAYWNKFRRPESVPLYGAVLDTWWEEPGRADALDR